MEEKRYLLMLNNSKNKLDSFKPVPFYFINTREPEYLKDDAIFSALEKLKKNNFGGCIVFNKPPFGFSREEYLSEKWFDLIRSFAEAGRKLKMQIWINDGFDFPPGDAGGRIQKLAPALKQRRLSTVGENDFEVREVEWGFPAFEEPESSRLFIELVYEEYRRKVGDYFGRGITGFFSDTDCRRINAHVIDKLSGQPYFPWSRNFAEEFQKKYGYDITPYLGAIVHSRAAAAVNRDYWSLAGKLYSGWFRNNYEWCRRHGLLYSFHTSDTGPFALRDCKRSSIFAEGSFLHQAQFCDYPGTDHELLALDGGTHFDSRFHVQSVSWGGSDKNAKLPDFNITKWDLRAKYTASAAYLFGKPKALCEAFAATNWGVSPQDLRRIATWQIMQGINFFVPHAVHHHFHGESKYFAPPEFLHGSLKNGLQEFNAALTEMCFIASQGELADPVAVLDPTEAVWKGKDHCLFDLCDRLNRMPVNYVMVNEEFLRDNPERFKFLLLPEIDLEPELKRCLKDNGCAILTADKVEQLAAHDIEFDGGDVHYMLRRLENGAEMLLVANVWNDTTLAGNLRLNGKLFNIELCPGEIAVINGPFEHFRKPSPEFLRIKLPDIMPVRWESDNVIPLPERESFAFCNTAEIPAPYIFVPPGGTVNFDGKILNLGKTVKFMGDRYKRVPLAGGGTPGKHLLKLTFPSSDACRTAYLFGDFDVKVKTENVFSRKYMSFYNLELYLPEKLEVTLSPRSNRLRPGCWTEQGAPFYSGAVTYKVKIPHAGGSSVLRLEKINGTCAVSLNGRSLGKRIWSPFEYELDLREGVNFLEITVSNTSANILEHYKAPGGLIPVNNL